MFNLNFQTLKGMLLPITLSSNLELLNNEIEERNMDIESMCLIMRNVKVMENMNIKVLIAGTVFRFVKKSIIILCFNNMIMTQVFDGHVCR